LRWWPVRLLPHRALSAATTIGPARPGPDHRVRRMAGVHRWREGRRARPGL